MLPPGPELLAANRRVLAERLDWPSGAVPVCEWMDHANPGWHTMWRHAYRDMPAGWYAWHDDIGPEPHLHGATPADLQTKITAHRCVNWPRQYKLMQGSGL